MPKKQTAKSRQATDNIIINLRDKSGCQNIEKIIIPQMESKIKRKLLEIGINPSLSGYDYMVDAIQRIIKDRDGYRTKITQLYKDVADKFDTRTCRVERNIRTVISSACQNGGNDKLKEIFSTFSSNTYDACLTNAHFIWGVVEHMLLEGLVE